jgi:hypothetical protein
VPFVPDTLLVLLVLVAGVFAPLSAWFAARRSRQPIIWFAFGALIGPLALALLALAPPGRCPSCGAPIEGWPSTCRQCGRALGSGEAAVAADAIASLAGGLGGDVTDTRNPPRPPRAPRTRSSRSSPAEPRVTPHERAGQAGESVESLTGEIVSIGVYVSGNAGLEIGATYALSRVSGPNGDRLRVFGPVDAGEITVRHEGPLDAFDVTGVDDRVIVSRRGRSGMVCVFRALGGKRGADLERALAGSPVSHP